MARHKWSRGQGKDHCIKCGAVRERGMIPAIYRDADGHACFNGAPPCDERLIKKDHEK